MVVQRDRPGTPNSLLSEVFRFNFQLGKSRFQIFRFLSWVSLAMSQNLFLSITHNIGLTS